MFRVMIAKDKENRVIPFCVSSYEQAIKFFMPISYDTAIDIALKKDDKELFEEIMKTGLPEGVTIVDITQCDDNDDNFLCSFVKDVSVSDFVALNEYVLMWYDEVLKERGDDNCEDKETV